MDPSHHSSHFRLLNVTTFLRRLPPVQISCRASSVVSEHYPYYIAPPPIVVYIHNLYIIHRLHYDGTQMLMSMSKLMISVYGIMLGNVYCIHQEE